MMGVKVVDVPETLFDIEESTTQTRGVKRSASLDALLKRKRDAAGRLLPKPRKKRAMAASTLDRAMVEMQEMIDARDWAGCVPRHLVALYVLMHKKTYGIEPTMSASERYRYAGMAAGFVKRAFAGDMTRALSYLRWVWTREIERERWRRENGREGGRLSFNVMLCNSLLDDWRLHQARRR